MNNIAIIGVGNLGKRHFQALLNSKHELNIYLADNSQKNLEEAIKLDDQNHNKNIYLINNISELPNKIDVVILATPSNVRANLIKELINKNKVIKYLVLEKVLFQSLEEYTMVSDLLKKNNIKAFVNCARRMYTGYKNLKEKLKNEEIMNIVISGGNWGLGCNAIHLIDLISFLCEKTETILLYNEFLDDEIIASKREGFIEFIGTILGEINNKIRFAITSNSKTSEPITMCIHTKNKVIHINENDGIVKIFDNNSVEIFELKMLFQSSLTNILVDSLLEFGECELTDYETSKKLHVPLIEMFLKHLQKQGKGFDGVCKIT